MRLPRQFLKNILNYRPPTCLYQGKNFSCSAHLLKSKDDYFITTPIFYVNSAPHIGHLYTAVLADSLSRWERLKGRNVLFATGTDEHGLKIQQAAQGANKPPLEFCDGVAAKFQELFRVADISHTDFIRTTEERHKSAVTAFWQTLESRGHIYKGKYEGWYSTSDEAFLTKDQVQDATDPDGNTIKVSVESGHPVEWMEEENYMFRLSSFSDVLKTWIKSGVIKPTKFADYALSMIGDGLADLSVSRQRDRLKWGIPVPNDESQSIYVWLDALVNYLTVAGYPNNTRYWPPDCQVIGKDIIRFHAIYWPAFLMAAEIQLPKSLFVHSHWTIDSMKMSKSRGNVVDPVQKLQEFGTDELKYFLLRQGIPHSDSNYSDHTVAEWIVADLSNGFGNLLNRCTGAKMNPFQVVPPFNRDVFNKFAHKECHSMLKQLKTLPETVQQHMEEYNIYKAVGAIGDQMRETHAFFQRHEPWKMKYTKIQHLNCILSVTLESLRIFGILSQPMMPVLSNRLLDRLAVPEDQRNFSDAQQLFVNTTDFKLGPKIGHLITPESYSHKVIAESKKEAKSAQN